MSHISTIELEIKDLSCLKKACENFNPPLQFMEGQKTFKWWGRFLGDSNPPPTVDVNNFGTCSHAIKVPNASYEIGVLQKGSNYELQWDYWSGGGLQDIVGKNGGKLKQAYTREVVKKEARAKGYSVMEKETEDGKIKMTITVPERK